MWASRRVNEGRVAVLIEGKEGRERRIQSKEAVERKLIAGGDLNIGSPGVVVGVVGRHHEVEPVGSAAQIDCNEQGIGGRGQGSAW